MLRRPRDDDNHEITIKVNLEIHGIILDCLANKTYKQAIISDRALHSANSPYMESQYPNREFSSLDWDHILSHMAIMPGECVLQDTRSRLTL
jgi:hypothetical protein